MANLQASLTRTAVAAAEATKRLADVVSPESSAAHDQSADSEPSASPRAPSDGLVMGEDGADSLRAESESESSQEMLAMMDALPDVGSLLSAARVGGAVEALSDNSLEPSTWLSASELALEVFEGAERLLGWADFVETLQRTTDAVPVDRAYFMASEWNAFRSGPSAFTVERSLSALQDVAGRASAQLDLAIRAFDQGSSLEDLDRQTDFSELGRILGLRMCGGACDVALHAGEIVQGTWAQLVRSVGGEP